MKVRSFSPQVEFDVSSPDPEVAATAADDLTQADFDLDANGEVLVRTYPARLIIHSDDLREPFEFEGHPYLRVSQRLRDWAIGVSAAIRDAGMKSVGWDGFLKISADDPAEWIPDITQAQSHGELLDETLANFWLVHQT